MKRLLILLIAVPAFGGTLKPNANKYYTARVKLPNVDTKITLGNEKSPADFEAHVKAEFWGGEETFSVAMPDIKGVASQSLEKDVTLPVTGGQQKWLITDSNSLKWLFRFDSKPVSNVYSMQFEGWEDFIFAFQRILAAEELFEKNGVAWLRSHDRGRAVARPLKVNGSYAVYHRTKRNHAGGRTNYAAGKVCHIYRPKATDAIGKSVWCDLHIENGVYSVTIPQKFIDAAAYPVIVNDEFGYHTEGGSNFSFIYGSENSHFMSGAMTAEGTLDSIGFYVEITSNVKGLCYTIDGDESPNDVQAVGAAVACSAEAWYLSTVASPPTLPAATYYAGVVAADEGGNNAMYYDDNLGASWISATTNYTTPANDPSGGEAADWRLSIYGVYTPTSGPGGAPQVIIITM